MVSNCQQNCTAIANFVMRWVVILEDDNFLIRLKHRESQWPQVKTLLNTFVLELTSLWSWKPIDVLQTEAV